MLDALFKPQAVAIVGASIKELSIGNVIIRNLQKYGYTGPIYPINPTAPEVCGLQAYKTLDEVPGPVDLAHVIIPAPMVPQAILECGQKGIKAVIINSAGFSEMGEEGARLQAVINLIQRVSQLLSDLPMIQEMDMNPIMAFADGVFAVDGRIRI
jgi:acetyltransferase